MGSVLIRPWHQIKKCVESCYTRLLFDPKTTITTTTTLIVFAFIVQAFFVRHFLLLTHCDSLLLG